MTVKTHVSFETPSRCKCFFYPVDSQHLTGYSTKAMDKCL
uniref:Uncharacterized protein n=1 Tax=Arundo donax TaxID=35708 RepID=A0A0A9DUF2_ARUDO